jgi:hydroxymethylpyrimidine pyrophosphatase-like HAD family hydrolase
MLRFHRDLGLEGFVVSSQGAVARGAETSEVLHQALLPTPHAAEVTAEGLERGLTVMVWTADGVFARQRTEWVDQYTADSGGDRVTIADVLSLVDGGAPVEKVVWGAEPEVVALLAPEMHRRYRSGVLMTVTEDWFLEFNSPSATKAEGVAAVAKHYGIDRSNVLAFGDGNNDVPLLEWAGLGVAMSHGRASARAAAKLVAPAGDPETCLSRAVDYLLAGARIGDGETSVQIDAAA